MSEATHGYIGRVKGCGHFVAAVIDSLERPKNTAQWVADFIKEGLAVERLPVEVIRAMKFDDCRCDEPQGDLFASAGRTGDDT